MAATRQEHTTDQTSGRTVAPPDTSAVGEQFAPSTGVTPAPTRFRTRSAPIPASGCGPQAVRGRAVVPVTAASIRSNMEVYDHEGVRIGRVREVREVDFRVDRRWRADIRVPIERVLAVMDRSVYLTAA